jgi:CubicO group peptidase (beta-lactamase class C family)
MNKLNLSQNWRCLLSALLLAGLCLNILSVNSALANEPAGRTQQDFETFFDAVLQEQMTSEHIAGVTTAVVQNGELVFAKGYGYADVDASIPVRSDRTLFFIGSDGKLFTWTAVMQLVEQGKLDLHTDINTYLDFEIPASFEKPINLHHLMTHTGGFEDEFNTLFVNEAGDLIPLREHLIRYMPARVYPPGEVMAYSNYGTALAGYIIERVSGQTIEAYLTEHLLQPLDMYHSFAGNALPPELAADLSKGHKYQNGVFTTSDFEWTSAVPVAPIRASATDLSRFMLAHLKDGCLNGNCILRPETVEQMHAMQFTHHPQMGGMAYGFMNMRVNGQKILWHLGNSPRFVTMLALIPEQNLGVIVSYNTPPADEGRAILFRFMDEFFPVERKPINQTPLPDWEARASLFNGNYAPARSNHTTPQVLVRHMTTTPVKIIAGRLIFNGWEFFESEPGVFQQVNGDRVLTFKEDENGKRWLFVGVLAYFQIPWDETPGFLLTIVGGSLLLTFSLLFARLFRRRQTSAPGAIETGLNLGLGLFNLALFAWLSLSLLKFGSTFVYPEFSVELIAKLYWLSVPWTMVVLVITLRAWLRHTWTKGGRIHYSLLTISALMFLWFLSKTILG